MFSSSADGRGRRRSAVWCCGLLLCCGAVSVAWAQGAGAGVVSADSANVRAGCSLDAEVVASLSQGTEVEVLGSLGDWQRVRLEDGREGCMHHSVLEVEEAGAAPEVVSVPFDEDPAPPAAEPAEPPAAAPAAVPSFEGEARSGARARERQAAGGRGRSGFFDIDLGVARAAEDSYSWRSVEDPSIFGGIFDSSVRYGLPEGDVLAAGGGVLFGRFGLGLRYSRQTHEDTAGISYFETFPFAPFVFEASGSTDRRLEREETAFHLSAVLAAVAGDSFALRLFAGPTYFDLSQDMVDMLILTAEPQGIAEVRYTSLSESTTGGHLGVDAAWYWGSFGIGLSGLYATGEADFEDPLCRRRALITGMGDCGRSVDVGGIQTGAGLRFRF